MNAIRFSRFVLALICFGTLAMTASKRGFHPVRAKRLGADERGMRMYVLCILTTGPKDSEIQGEERKQVFAGPFANIGRLADEGKLAVAGPFGKNDKAFR